MFCTTCACSNLTGSAHCRACGSDLSKHRNEQPTSRTASTAGDRRGIRFALHGVALGAVIILLAGAANATRNDAPRWYARGEAALAAGGYRDALTAFAAAGDHRDATAREAALAAVVGPSELALREAADALAADDPERAIALVRPVLRTLPRDNAAAQLLREARSVRELDLRREADEAELGRDWLVVEDALVRLAALNPADETTADRLADVRRHHSPLILARDRALWLVGPDGSDDRLLLDDHPVAWPTWSPDRSRIAFTADGAGAGIDLFVFDLESGSARRLADGLRPYGGPVWSPDGDRIAFAAAGIDGPLSGGAEAGIRVVDVATGGVTDVSAGRVQNALYPSWSPDGERLAFVSREDEGGGYAVAPAAGPLDRDDPSISPTGELYVVDLASGRLDNLSRGRVAHPWRATWSPTGEGILVFTREPGMSYDRDHARLALVDATTGTIADVPTAGERITTPVWSPDGTRIAYAAGEHDVVVRAIGGGVRRVTLDSSISRFLAWSPDGRSLLAVAEGLGGPSYVIPLAAADRNGPAADLAPRPLRLPYDADRRQSGAPQWAPVHLAPDEAAPAVSGTSLDPSASSPLAHR